MLDSNQVLRKLIQGVCEYFDTNVAVPLEEVGQLVSGKTGEQQLLPEIEPVFLQQAFSQLIHLNKQYELSLIQLDQSSGQDILNIKMLNHLLDKLYRLDTLYLAPVKMHYQMTTASTNQDASVAILPLDIGLIEQAADLHFFVSEGQTSGKGRQGNRWQASYADSILTSFCFKTALPISQFLGFSLAIGVWLHETLSGFLNEEARLELKWPNDVYLNGKKLAGILIEQAPSDYGTLWVVGIGINLNVESLQNDLEPAQGSVLPIGMNEAGLSEAALDKTKVLLNLISVFKRHLPVYIKKGFEAYRSKWQSVAAFMDEVVSFKESINDQSIEIKGRLVGVNDQGAMIVDVLDEKGNIVKSKAYTSAYQIRRH